MSTATPLADLPVPADRPIPQARLHVADYHLRGPTVRVPSPAADELAGHLHGWLYRLQGADPDERLACDPEAHLAPFAAWLLGDGHPSRREGQVSVRVCWYSDAAAQRSTAALAANPTALIGCQPYALSGIAPVTRQPITAASLLAQEELASRVRIETISPVGFRRHTRDHCSLDGPTVLGAALDRWLRLWPATLPEGVADERPGWMARVAISGCELRSALVRRGKVEQCCLRGWVEWDLYGLDKPQRRCLALALLRGAEAYGLGSRCAYGLGAIRVTVLR